MINQEYLNIVTEARRCLFCFDAPCVKKCPAGVDVPSFIRYLRYGNPKSAKKAVKDHNVLGGICGRLCPSEDLCQSGCVMNAYDNPIHIRDLQKYVCDNASYAPAEALPNGKKVAVIGAGPAGIGCAAALAAMGYAVDVFEKEDRAAGVVSGEIPRFRISDEEIEADLRELDPSIKFHFGREISSAELEGMAGEYDAVFVGAGLRFDRFTGVDIAEGASGVYGCAAFLKKLKSGELGSLSGTVFVIGGGNSALDSAASALLHGASKAVIAYRRSRNEMPSCSEEFLDTADRGVELMYMVSPVAVRPKGDGLEITFRRNELVDAPGEARKSFRGIPGSEFTAEASCMVFAVGKSGDEGLVSGTADESTCRIGDTNCFAGGDFTHGGGTIVEAVADGKKAAAAIDAFLS